MQSENGIKNSNNMRSNRIDRTLSRVIWIFYLLQTLNIVIKITIPMSDRVWSLLSNVFMGLIALILLFTLRFIVKRKIVFFIVSEIFLGFLFLVSYLQGNAAIGDLLNHGFWAIFVSIPLAIYFISIKDKDIFYEEAIKFSFIILIISSIGLINMETEVYSMALAYSMTISLLIQINQLNKKLNTKNFIFTIIPFALLVLYGSRGPLINIMFFIFILLIRNMRNKFSFKKAKLIMLGFPLLVITLLFSNQILLQIVNILENNGIYSRTIYKLISGNIYDSTGRLAIYDYYLNLITQKPLFGWGLLGGWIQNTSPHNLIIEIILAFGVAFGGFLSVVIIITTLRPLFTKSDDNNLYAIYAASNFMMLFVSGEFLTKYNFFIMLFFFIDIQLKKSRIKIGGK
jgi:hypothetical protein